MFQDNNGMAGVLVSLWSSTQASISLVSLFSLLHTHLPVLSRGAVDCWIQCSCHDNNPSDVQAWERLMIHEEDLGHSGKTKLYIYIAKISSQSCRTWSKVPRQVCWILFWHCPLPSNYQVPNAWLFYELYWQANKMYLETKPVRVNRERVYRDFDSSEWLEKEQVRCFVRIMCICMAKFFRR